MNQLPEDLIFSIFLFCQKTHDVSTLLLLNRHWLAVARYEALWRMRFAFYLNERIRNEEESLADNPQALATSRSRGQIRKLKTLAKSHIDESEKLYTREKVCDECVADREKGVDFYTGFRFYGIFKKEVQGKIIGKMTEKLMELMSCNMERTYYPVSDNNILTSENPMKKKWSTFIEFVDTNLKPDSEYLATDQCYMFQKNCSAQFAIKFEADFIFMSSKLRNYLIKSQKETEIRQEYSKAISNIIEPIRIVTDPSKYKYPIDAYKCLQIAIDSMNFDLVQSLLIFIKKDRKRSEEERQYRDIFVKKGEQEFVRRLMSSFLRFSYPVENIMYFLSSIIEIFPSLIEELKKKDNTIKFKCDEDLLANSIIGTRCYYSNMELSMELFEKAIRDWGYPNDGSNFAAKMFYDIYNLCKVSDFSRSFRKDVIGTKEMIYLIELYEEVSGIKCDDEIAYLCASFSSNIELCKYFTDTRGLSLSLEKYSLYQYPLPYGYLYNTYPSAAAYVEMIEYLVDRLENFYNYEVGDRVRHDPLHKLLYAIIYDKTLQSENEEQWFRVLRKLLDKKPNLSHLMDGISSLDILNIESDSIYLEKTREIIAEYQLKWAKEQ